MKNVFFNTVCHSHTHRHKWNIENLGSCVFCAPHNRYIGRYIDRHISRVSVHLLTDARPICRSTCRPIYWWTYLITDCNLSHRHNLSLVYVTSAEQYRYPWSTECWPLYRPRYLPIVGRYVNHISTDISTDMSVYISVDRRTKYTWPGNCNALSPDLHTSWQTFWNPHVYLWEWSFCHSTNWYSINNNYTSNFIHQMHKIMVA